MVVEVHVQLRSEKVWTGFEDCPLYVNFDQASEDESMAQVKGITKPTPIWHLSCGCVQGGDNGQQI